MSIGNNIKNHRINCGLSQSQLGKLIGVSGPAIAQLEQRDKEIRKSTLVKVAKALQVDIRALTYVPDEDRKIDEFERYLEAHGIIFMPKTINNIAGQIIDYEECSSFRTNEEISMMREYLIDVFKLLNQALDKIQK